MWKYVPILALLVISSCQFSEPRRTDVSKFTLDEVKLSPEKFIGKKVRWEARVQEIERLGDSVKLSIFYAEPALRKYLTNNEEDLKKYLITSAYFITEKNNFVAEIWYISQNTEPIRQFLLEAKEKNKSIIIHGEIDNKIGSYSVLIDGRKIDLVKAQEII